MRIGSPHGKVPRLSENKDGNKAESKRIKKQFFNVKTSRKFLIFHEARRFLQN